MIIQLLDYSGKEHPVEIPDETEKCNNQIDV